MTPAEKFLTMLEANTNDYMDTLKDGDGRFVEAMDQTELQNIYNSTMQDFLETYLQADVIWIGFSNTVPPTPDPYIGASGWTVSFSAFKPLPVPVTPPPPGTAYVPTGTEPTLFDQQLSLYLKMGMVNIPASEMFNPITPMMLNTAGMVTTNVATACTEAPTDSESSRKVSKKIYKQLFDSICLMMFNPVPSTGVHNTSYSGSLSMANLYFKPITDTSTTHPETLYKVTPKHEIKFLARDTQAPSAMVSVFTKEYGYKTDNDAKSAAQSATTSPYTYKTCSTEKRTTTMPYDDYIAEYGEDPELPVDEPVDVDRYYVKDIQATVSTPKLYSVRTLTSEGYNVTEGSNCEIQIVFTEDGDGVKWDTYYKITKIEWNGSSASTSGDYKYSLGPITANCDFTVYLETK